MINVEFVKQLMKERNMAQKNLAIDAHLTAACVSRVLNGKRYGGLEFLEGLIRAFPDVDIGLFLKTEQTNPPQRVENPGSE